MPDSVNPEKPAVTLPGTVERIIPANSVASEKAQISVQDAEHLYQNIRIENTLTDESGKEVCLKPGAHVEVTIQAEEGATTPKN